MQRVSLQCLATIFSGDPVEGFLAAKIHSNRNYHNGKRENSYFGYAVGEKDALYSLVEYPSSNYKQKDRFCQTGHAFKFGVSVMMVKIRGPHGHPYRIKCHNGSNYIQSGMQGFRQNRKASSHHGHNEFGKRKG